jgi:hypothetical protein
MCEPASMSARTQRVALDKSIAPLHLPAMAGATPTQLLVKIRRGRAHHDRNPSSTHGRRAGDWRNRLVALRLIDPTMAKGRDLLVRLVRPSEVSASLACRLLRTDSGTIVLSGVALSCRTTGTCRSGRQTHGA